MTSKEDLKKCGHKIIDVTLEYKLTVQEALLLLEYLQQALLEALAEQLPKQTKEKIHNA